MSQRQLNEAPAIERSSLNVFLHTADVNEAKGLTLRGAKGVASEVLETGLLSALDKAALRIAVAAAAGEDGNGAAALATACFMA